MSSATGSQSVTGRIFDQLSGHIKSTVDSLQGVRMLLTYGPIDTGQITADTAGNDQPAPGLHAHLRLSPGEVMSEGPAACTPFAYSAVGPLWSGEMDTPHETAQFLKPILDATSKSIDAWTTRLDRSLDKFDELLDKAADAWDHDKDTFGAETHREGLERGLASISRTVVKLGTIASAVSNNLEDVSKVNIFVHLQDARVISWLSNIPETVWNGGHAETKSAICDVADLETKVHTYTAIIELADLHRKADPRPHFKEHTSLIMPLARLLQKHQIQETFWKSRKETCVQKREERSLEAQRAREVLSSLGYSSFQAAITAIRETPEEAEQSDHEEAKPDFEGGSHDPGEESSIPKSNKKKRRAKKKGKSATGEASTIASQLNALSLGDASIAGSSGAPDEVPQISITPASGFTIQKLPKEFRIDEDDEAWFDDYVEEALQSGYAASKRDDTS